MIKSAISYTVEMPTIAEMRKFIEKSNLTVTRPTSQQRSTFGFEIHPVTKELVSEFEGGYCLTLKQYEKKIDAKALREVLNAKYQNIEDETGVPLKRKEKDAIKDDTVLDLLPGILPTPKVVFVYYRIASKTLIVDTAETKMADNATSLLRKCIGSLEATTLYIDAAAGLTAKLAEYLHTITLDDFIPGLKLGTTVELKHLIEGAVKYKDMKLTEDGTSVEIVDMIRDAHMYVKTIELHSGDDFLFELTDGFKMKGIKYTEFDSGERKGSHDEWLTETFYSMFKITQALGHITSAFQVVK